VRAHLHGNEYADQQSIAGAHYDDILKSGDPYSNVPGANDNASGVALTLEVARVMAKNGYKPRGSINFVAFAAEEFDLQGSRYYVHDAAIHDDKILMMINNDMVAYETGTKIPTWQMNVSHYSNSYSLLQEAMGFCWKYTSVSPVIDNTNAKKSDSYSFFLGNQMAVYFSSRQTDPNYHTVNDKSASLNFDYCKELAKITCALLVLKN
jgi:Zn-dependent M28 family amino/carboxypeptidase